MSRRNALLGLLLLTVLGGAMRFYRLDLPAIWLDEASTFARTHGTHADLIRALSDAGFGPIHYHLVWWISQGLPYWGTFELAPPARGFDENDVGGFLHFVPTRRLIADGIVMTPFYMRLVPAIFGTLMIPAVYWLGRQFAGRRAALIAATLTVFSAYLLNYSRDAKMYADLWLLATVHIASLLVWLRRRSVLMWIAWILSGMLMVGVQLQGIAVLVVGLLIALTAPQANWRSMAWLLAAMGRVPLLILTGVWESIAERTGPLRTVVGRIAGDPFLRKAANFRTPILPPLLAGLLLIGTLPTLYFVTYNRFTQNIKDRGWQSTGITWVEDYNAGRTGPGLVAYTGTAFMTGWELPHPSPIFRGIGPETVQPWVRRSLTGSVLALLGLAALGCWPWPRRWQWADPSSEGDAPGTSYDAAAGRIGDSTSGLASLAPTDEPADTPFGASSVHVSSGSRADGFSGSSRSVFGETGRVDHDATPTSGGIGRPPAPGDALAGTPLGQWTIGQAPIPRSADPAPLAIHASVARTPAGKPAVRTGGAPTYASASRRAFWLLTWILLPTYATYCASIANPTSPLDWVQGAWGAAAGHPGWAAIVAIVLAGAFWFSGVNWRRRLVVTMRVAGTIAATLAVVLTAYYAFRGIDAILTRSLGSSWTDHGSIWMPRYVGIVLPALLVGMGVLIARLPTWPLRAGAMGLFVAANLGQFIGRLHYSEPPTGVMVADVLAAKNDPGTSILYAVPSRTGNIGPGAGVLYHMSAQYYMIVQEKRPPGDGDLNPFYARLNAEFPPWTNPATLNDSARQIANRTPPVNRLVVWEGWQPTPNPARPADASAEGESNASDESPAIADDPILKALGDGWSRTADDRYLCHDHWTWRRLLTLNRREYTRAAPPALANPPADAPAGDGVKP